LPAPEAVTGGGREGVVDVVPSLPQAQGRQPGELRDSSPVGRSEVRAFNTSTICARARRAWDEAGMTPIGLRECRHTFASLMIAAGVNAKALAAFIGHSSVTITLDRYGHLMPGSEDEAQARLAAVGDATA
jgi:integrase